MKKLVCLAFLFSCFSGFAQNFQPGLKGGVNISNFTGGDFSDVKKKTLIGIHAGGLLRFRFGSNLALQPEVVFSTQGAKFEDAGNEFDAKLSYINIPVLLQVHTNSGFFVEAGPQIGFKVSEDIGDQPVEDFAKSTDLSIALGLGFQTKSGFGIGARYNVGLSKVGDFDTGDFDPDFKNGVIQLGIFFTFFNNE